MFIDGQELEEALNKAGLNQWKPQLTALARPTALLVPIAKLNGEAPLGCTRVGGRPDLPRSMAWPVRMPYAEGSFQRTHGPGSPDRKLPLSFVAQINLADIAEQVQFGDSFPDNGLLYFFYDALVGPWGFDPGDAAGWKVVYSQALLSELERRDLPDSFGDEDAGPESRFKPVVMAPMAFLTIPDMWSFQLEQLGAPFRELDSAISPNGPVNAFNQILVDLDSEAPSPWHQFGGHAATIQNSMEPECQLVSNGIHCGSGDGYRSDRALELASGASDWLLLLQVDSDENAGMVWGSFGRLYFWIREQDLAARRFDKVWTILQCI